MGVHLVACEPGWRSDDAVVLLAGHVVSSMDDETLDEVMAQSAEFLRADGRAGGGAAIAVGAVDSYLRSDVGVVFMDQLLKELHESIDGQLAACLALALGQRIAGELGTESDRPTLTVAP